MSEVSKCPSCGKEVGSKAALTRHVRSEHGDNAVTELIARHGDMSPRPGGAHRLGRPLSAAPSGVPSIDYAIGIGGLPRGTLCEIYGPPSSGKTLTALTFASRAQADGGLASYVDAEHALQPTFAMLVPGLDLDKLEYCEPRGGEQVLNISKDFIASGKYAVWIIDSVHACVPEAMVNKPIGEATMMELARLMSVGCQVLDYIIAETNTVCIFVNHVKAKPTTGYGKDWSKPGGSALDYYTSIQLHVRPVATFNNKDGRKVGHTVKVKVEKSKVAAPFATAEYDVYYRNDTIHKPADSAHHGQVVTSGIDIGSSWFSVCQEAGLLAYAGNRYFDSDSGEALGYRREVIEMLREDCELRERAERIVYPDIYAGVLGKAA